MTIVELMISTGAIRIFDSSNVEFNSFSEYLDNPNLLAVSNEAAKTVAALELLSANSATFLSLLASVTPTSALWIDLATSPGIPVDTFIDMPTDEVSKDPRLANVAGFIKIDPNILVEMIWANGEIVNLPYARILAHEISHVVNNTRDPHLPMTGPGPILRSTYLGEAAVFENAVVAELEQNGHDMGGFRTSYHSLSAIGLPGMDPATVQDLTENVAALMGIQTASATFGHTVDLVLLDQDTSDDPLIYGPGANIDTSQNTDTVDDLILATTLRPNMANLISTGNGTDFVYGGAGDDTIYGGADGDFIAGGSGNDALYGGDGNDWLVFGAADEFIFGGNGRDVALATGLEPIIADMTAMEIEVLIGGGGDDTLSVGEGAGVMMIAGGAGADVITVSYGAGLDTRVLWGGDDAVEDVFNFVWNGDYSEGTHLGILVATVTGLTAANFASFSLAMLGLPETFDWGAIDAVILNPSPEDRVSMWGGILDTAPIRQEVYAITSIDENRYDGDYDLVWTNTSVSATQGMSSVLGTSLFMQAPDSDTQDVAWYREGIDFKASFLDGNESSQTAIDDFLDERGTPSATWAVDMSAYDADGDGTGVVWNTPAAWAGAPDPYASWFVAGGSFAGKALAANGSVFAVMPEDTGSLISDWLLAA